MGLFMMCMVVASRACPDSCECLPPLETISCQGLTQIPDPLPGFSRINFFQCRFTSIIELNFWFYLSEAFFYESEIPCDQVPMLENITVYSECIFTSTFHTSEAFTNRQTSEGGTEITHTHPILSEAFTSTDRVITTSSEANNHFTSEYTTSPPSFGTVPGQTATPHLPPTISYMKELIAVSVTSAIIILGLALFIIYLIRKIKRPSHLGPAVIQLEMQDMSSDGYDDNEVNDGPIFRPQQPQRPSPRHQAMPVMYEQAVNPCPIHPDIPGSQSNLYEEIRNNSS